MTNKLLRVIDNKIKACKGIYGFFPQNDHTNDQELCVKVELVEILMKEGLEELLDGIIEQLEKDPGYLTKPSNEYEEAFDHGYTHVITVLKQAREELSTSLTQ